MQAELDRVGRYALRAEMCGAARWVRKNARAVPERQYRPSVSRRRGPRMAPLTRRAWEGTFEAKAADPRVEALLLRPGVLSSWWSRLTGRGRVRLVSRFGFRLPPALPG